MSYIYIRVTDVYVHQRMIQCYDLWRGAKLDRKTEKPSLDERI